MDRSYRYTHRLERRARLARQLAAMAVIAMAGGAMAFALSADPDPTGAGLQQAAPSLALLSAAPPARATTRRVYPYSVVPGGVASQAELVRIVRNDRVVATHYASFDLSRVREVTVRKPRAVHVSYRKGNKVYWTAKKVMLREGETLLSDGRNEMRTRCANRVSDVAQFPVEAHEPSAELLDTAFDEDLADAEDGRRINASMELAEDIALAWAGQQPQLPGLPDAAAGQVAPRMAGGTDRSGTRTVAKLGAVGMPGAVAATDATASSGGVSTAPALIVAMDNGQSNGAATEVSGGSSTTAQIDFAASAASAANQPALAVTPKPGVAASFPPAAAGDATPKPTELPEPGTAWLVALALTSMLALRGKR